MEQIVVDSIVIVASFLDWEDFHQGGQSYINGLETGDYTFHLPMLVVVEVTSAISRRAQRGRQALLMTWKQNVTDWERDGKLFTYPLERDRMENAVNIAIRDRLRGSDVVIAALAEELAMPLKTFDQEVLDRFSGASV
jgi:predicted nucleic acid-binding protein